MADTSIQEGDKASWQWSGSRPSGEVAEVKEHGELSIQSNKGNIITKKASPDDPAVHLAREGNDVVKRAHELTVDAPAEKKAKSKSPAPPAKKAEEPVANGGEKTNGAAEPEKDAKAEKEETNGDAAETGDKRKASEPAVEENGAKEEEPKKQKTNGAAAAADGEKKPKGKPGRPKKAAADKKAPAKKREPKKAATESGEPRRSGRNKA